MRRSHVIPSGLLLAFATNAALAQTSSVIHRFDGTAGPQHAPSAFAHADPNAPKGGEARLAATGSFDSTHPYILRGVPALGLDLTFDTLTVAGEDPHLRHCLLCERVEVTPERDAATFTLRREARFHDGTPVTAEDLIWTFRTLVAYGHPTYRIHYADVASVAPTQDGAVRFTFRAPSRDLPLLLGELPVLSKRWWSGRDFARPLLEAPLGSGPYRLAAFESGRHVTLQRVPGYWGRDLAVNRGRYNLDTIRIDYYRDDTVALEAFKAGRYDIRFERHPVAWATGYDSPAVAQQVIRREEIAEDRVSGMSGFVMNTRRAPFQDRRVRAALAYALDFEWTNRVFFHGAYVRTRSFFNNADLSAVGLPDGDERAILETLKDRLPNEVFAAEYHPPRTDGSGKWREHRRAAMRLLREAGYRIEDGVLVDRFGQAFSFEILLDAAQLERVALSYAANLRRLGIDAQVRTVDTAQYQHRLETYDFDMTAATFGQSEAPGSEQRGYWTSAEADRPGGANLAGIRDPAVDALVELVIAAPDRNALVTRTRALDRVLQWGHYVVPFWHMKVDRIAWWDRFGRPARSPRAGVDLTFWWIDAARNAKVKAWRSQAGR